MRFFQLPKYTGTFNALLLTFPDRYYPLAKINYRFENNFYTFVAKELFTHFFTGPLSFQHEKLNL
jgi:hypothetical protein